MADGQDTYDVIGNIMTLSSNRLKFQFNQCCLRLTMDVLMWLEAADVDIKF